MATAGIGGAHRVPVVELVLPVVGYDCSDGSSPSDATDLLLECDITPCYQGYLPIEAIGRNLLFVCLPHVCEAAGGI